MAFDYEGERQCTKCLRCLPKRCFSPSGVDGLRGDCKACHSAAVSARAKARGPKPKAAPTFKRQPRKINPLWLTPIPAVCGGPLVPSLGVRVVMFLDESAECRRCA